ncbi:MAG: hypothetical protein ACOX7B_08010 [Christensenellales bacterium]|jgi:predicted phosphodiesterase
MGKFNMRLKSLEKKVPKGKEVHVSIYIKCADGTVMHNGNVLTPEEYENLPPADKVIVIRGHTDNEQPAE